jgi:hypothetical protein
MGLNFITPGSSYYPTFPLLMEKRRLCMDFFCNGFVIGKTLQAVLLGLEQIPTLIPGYRDIFFLVRKSSTKQF